MAATETITTMIWSHPTFTPSRRTEEAGRNWGKLEVLAPYQSVPTPSTTSRMPTVATTFSVAPTGSRARASSSSPRPSRGASTSRHSAAANGQAIPCSSWRK